MKKKVHGLLLFKSNTQQFAAGKKAEEERHKMYSKHLISFGDAYEVDRGNYLGL